jgi:endonuclease/exonuclease/phosphatase family metal-dependent hydrolase
MKGEMHAHKKNARAAKSAGKKKARELNLRIMTYNIHSCVNMDGQVLPKRIVDVIHPFDPDVIALQEVDAGIPRTRNQDQAKFIANALDMDYRFFPVITQGSQKYGLTILSRFTFLNVSVDWLPVLYPRLKLNLQRRGVMWAILETSAGPVHFFNTHLSLFQLERLRQVRALLSKDWLMAVPADEAVVFCGDLNAIPFSPVYRRLSRYLMDARKNSPHSLRSRPTFPSRRPIFRIDHIFISKHFRPLRTVVPVDESSRLASDHLPLYAELQLAVNQRFK